jgi:tetratricopeptide (TPR) repeat protein
MLSGYPNKAAGRYQQALAEAQKAIEADPDFAIAYYNLGVNNLYLGRVEEAENILRRAAGRGLEIDELLMLEHDIAFLKDDHAAMERAAARARERSGGDTWISNKEAFAQAYFGHLHSARVLSQRAAGPGSRGKPTGKGRFVGGGASLREAFFGNRSQARETAVAALRHSNNREVEFGAALALTMTGDFSRAQSLAADIDERFPEDTVVHLNYLPVLRARLALGQGDAAKAIEQLEVTAPYELGASRFLFGALYPVYFRGEAPWPPTRALKRRSSSKRYSTTVAS